MFFELQLSESLFARIVRNRIKNVPLCVDQELPDLDGTPLAVDRIEVGDGTEVQREKKLDLVNGVPQEHDSATQVVWILSPTNHTSMTVPFLQVKQEILIHLVKVSDLELNGPNPSPVHRTLTIRPVFNVKLSAANQTQGGGPLTLSYTLTYIDLGLLGLGLSEAQRAEIERVVAGVRLEPTTLDFGPLTNQLDRPVSAINAGIACDPAGSFVAMRVDFDIHATPPALDRAFFQAGPVNRLGAGREWAMLIDADVLTEGVRGRVGKGLRETPKVRLNSGPTVIWEPAVPALIVNADVELVDACKFFVDDIDMDAHIRINSSFSVPTPNTLRTHHHLKGEPSDLAEEVACALTAALLWPFIGTILLGEEGVELDKYLLLMILPPYIRFLLIMVAIETKGVSSNLSGDLGNNCVKLDDSNYQCNDPLDIVLPLSPPFNSRFDLLAVSGVREGLVLSGTVSNLGNTPVGNLERVDVTPFAWEILGHCTGNGTNNFRVGNEAKIELAVTPPAKLCSARVVTDPLQEFAIAMDPVAGSIAITPRFTVGYTSSPNPYPCQVRLVTTRGVRTITLQPPERLRTAKAEELERARIGAAMTCYFWEEHHSKAEELQWVPDPPPETTHPLYLWQIVVRSLHVEETIHIQTHALGTVLTAHASPQGIAHMTMLFEGDSAPAALSLELSGRQEASAREISVQQVLYGRQASLPAQGALHTMRFEGGSGDQRLIVADEEQEMTWRVSSASPAPSLLSSLAREVDASEDGLVVQTGKRIGVDRGKSLRRTLKTLRERDPDLDYVASPRIGGIGEALAVRRKGRSTVYDISGTEPKEIQVFEAPAWFEGTALGGDLLARHDPDAGAVHVYAAVAQAFK